MDKPVRKEEHFLVIPVTPLAGGGRRRRAPGRLSRGWKAELRQVLALAAVVLLAGCASRDPEQRFLEEVGNLSKDEIVARGDAAAARKRWEEARRYYSFVADAFPNDPVGRQAALKIADSFFRGRDLESITEAQLRYRDFANRFPNDPQRPYALLMLGKCSLEQARGPQRDLSPVKEALGAFAQVIELYPDSEFATEARELRQKCTEDLAQHELAVARFYWRQGALLGARHRLEYLLANYPDTEAARVGASLLEEINAVLTGMPAGKREERSSR